MRRLPRISSRWERVSQSVDSPDKVNLPTCEICGVRIAGSRRRANAALVKGHRHAAPTTDARDRPHDEARGSRRRLVGVRSGGTRPPGRQPSPYPISAGTRRAARQGTRFKRRRPGRARGGGTRPPGGRRRSGQRGIGGWSGALTRSALAPPRLAKQTPAQRQLSGKVLHVCRARELAHERLERQV